MNPNICLIGIAYFIGAQPFERLVATDMLIYTGQPHAVQKVLKVPFLQLL